MNLKKKQFRQYKQEWVRHTSDANYVVMLWNKAEFVWEKYTAATDYDIFSFVKHNRFHPEFVRVFDRNYFTAINVKKLMRKYGYVYRKCEAVYSNSYVLAYWYKSTWTSDSWRFKGRRGRHVSQKRFLIHRSVCELENISLRRKSIPEFDRYFYFNRDKTNERNWKSQGKQKRQWSNERKTQSSPSYRFLNEHVDNTN